MPDTLNATPQSPRADTTRGRAAIAGPVIALMIAATGWLGGIAAAADDYPARPVKVVVPFAPGGSTDIIARLAADELTRALGKSFIVENLPGAGGIVGTVRVIGAPPDGYMLLATSPGPISIFPALQEHLSYNPEKDLVSITVVSEGPGVLVVGRDSRFRSVADIVAAAKAAPGTVTFASSGQGAFSHLNGEFFKLLAGIDLTHVPYRGAGPAAVDVMAGRVDMTIEYFPANRGFVDSGELKALAITTLKRYPLRPEIPTFDEAGVKGYDTSAWIGLAAPAGTPKDIVDKISAVIQRAGKDPAFVDKLAKLGTLPVGNGPAESVAYTNSERDSIRKLGQTTGLRLSDN